MLYYFFRMETEAAEIVFEQPDFSEKDYFSIAVDCCIFLKELTRKNGTNIFGNITADSILEFLDIKDH